ncbi:putative fasciclin-like arabinogalactan protein [Rosa chinensis]|uniref:Putative fasciclin-like arabinogalactan protein n=1 Tax=Rosa chinensis TaxID=74649 RepID=A0A2P6SG66_ROSCH|nr:fasciclin-like arabinogalactan protein 10 [Rosa chinensis]PRQ57670.1 putative fasciclin-like arabinogalactan protein [Rosa chinensis]
MASSRCHLLLLTLLSLAAAISAHNITAILEANPEYSQYNSFLTQTRLADEINTRTTVTVLVLTNGVMSSLAAKHPLSVIKNALSLHILLDYYDPAKLHKISDGSVLTTTLYQTTGHAPGNLGFVNITDLSGGKVGFGSAAPGSKLDSSYTKSVKQIPYNISVLEISAPVIAPGILTAPAPSASDLNITALLEKAGCKTFASLIVSSGVLKTFQTTADKGLTLFVPNDEAFKAKGVPDLTKLTNAEVVSLLQYHAVPKYTPKGALKTTKDPISTLATNGAGKYDLTVTTSGDQVTLHTGVVSSRVADTVLDSTPFSVFTVDSVLLPTELFGKSPSPAPSMEPVAAPSPTPVVAPSPASVEAPSPSAASPPAPPSETPEGAPSDAPSAAAADSTSANGAGHVTSPALLMTVLTVASVTVISFVFLS